jgi:hypothetical protein
MRGRGGSVLDLAAHCNRLSPQPGNLTRIQGSTRELRGKTAVDRKPPAVVHARLARSLDRARERGQRGRLSRLEECVRQGKPVQYRRGPRHCDRGQSSANPLGEEPGKGRAASDPASQETYCVRARSPPILGSRGSTCDSAGCGGEASAAARVRFAVVSLPCPNVSLTRHPSWHSVVRAGGSRAAEHST